MTAGLESSSAPLARSTSRRSLIKAAGVVGAAASVAVVTGGAQRAAAAPQRREFTFDAIVVGGGFAGVTAARELQARGIRTVLLEARNRLGGRTWTDSFNGYQVEMGGTWVTDTQPHVWSEIHRHGIQLVPEVAPDNAIFPTPAGFQSFSPADAFPHLGELVGALSKGSEDYFPRPFEPFTREDLLLSVDSLTLRDRIQQMNLSPVDELWLGGTTSEQAGGNASRGALTQMAQWWALCGWNADNFLSLNSLRLQPGMLGLIRAMLNVAPPQVRLNSPVTAIAESGGQVRVTTSSGDVYVGRAVVVATPVNLWRTIRFTPELPAANLAVSNAGIGVPNGKKVWIQIRGDVGRIYGQSAEGGLLSSVHTHTVIDGNQILVGFSVNPTLNLSDPAQVQRALRVFIPDVQVLSVKAQDWGADPYSRGGWPYKQPLQLLRYLRQIQRPHGLVSFATSDIANGWSGFVDGAIESGLSAARNLTATVLR